MNKHADDLVKMQTKRRRGGKSRVVAFNAFAEKEAGAGKEIFKAVEPFIGATFAGALTNAGRPAEPTFGQQAGQALVNVSQSPYAPLALAGLLGGGYGLYRYYGSEPQPAKRKVALKTAAAECVNVIEPAKNETRKSILMKKRIGQAPVADTPEGTPALHVAANYKGEGMNIESLLEKISEPWQAARDAENNRNRYVSDEAAAPSVHKTDPDAGYSSAGIPINVGNPADAANQQPPMTGHRELNQVDRERMQKALPGGTNANSSYVPAEPGLLERMTAWLKNPENLPYIVGGAGLTGAGAYALGRYMSGGKKKKKKKVVRASCGVGIYDIFAKMAAEAECESCATAKTEGATKATKPEAASIDKDDYTPEVPAEGEKTSSYDIFARLAATGKLD